MKTITAYAVVQKGVVLSIHMDTVNAGLTAKANDGEVVKLTGEYDDTPKLKPCPFCGGQPKTVKSWDMAMKPIEYLACCNGIETDIDGWESRV